MQHVNITIRYVSSLIGLKQIQIDEKAAGE